MTGKTGFSLTIKKHLLALQMKDSYASRMYAALGTRVVHVITSQCRLCSLLGVLVFTLFLVEIKCEPVIMLFFFHKYLTFLKQSRRFKPLSEVRTMQ